MDVVSLLNITLSRAAAGIPFSSSCISRSVETVAEPGNMLQTVRCIGIYIVEKNTSMTCRDNLTFDAIYPFHGPVHNKSFQ